MLKSLSPIDVALIKKIGGNGSSYTLPIASSTQLGGVQPTAKTDAMTQAVGVDAGGALWTAAGGSGGAVTPMRFITRIDVVPDVTSYEISVDSNGDAFNLKNVLFVAPKFLSTNYIEFKPNGITSGILKLFGENGGNAAWLVKLLGDSNCLLFTVNNAKKQSAVEISKGYGPYGGSLNKINFWFPSAVSSDMEILVYGDDA